MLRSTTLTEDSLRYQMMIEFGEAGVEIVDKMRLEGIDEAQLLRALEKEQDRIRQRSGSRSSR